MRHLKGKNERKNKRKKNFFQKKRRKKEGSELTENPPGDGDRELQEKEGAGENSNKLEEKGLNLVTLKNIFDVDNIPPGPSFR